MIKNNNLFDCLNWILRKKEDKNIENKNTSFYILNRWLSMIDENYVKIINSTTNTWISKNNSFNNDLYLLKFLKLALPKHYKKINYLKKNKDENQLNESFDFINEISSGMEISQSELKSNLHLLQQLYDKET